jgi:hypothetical protein
MMVSCTAKTTRMVAPDLSSRRHARFVLRVAVTLIIATSFGFVPANCHTVDGFLPLRFHKLHSPFGFDETETYTEVWGANDLAFLGSLSSGVAIIDVSDPRSPRTISEFGFDLGIGFHDVRTAGDVGFFSTFGVGTHIVDLSTPSDPVQIARVSAEIQGFDSVTNAMVYGDYLFQVSAASSEIAVTDISNPSTPKFVARLDTGDSVGIYDVTIVDDRLYAAGLGGADGEGAAYIYNVSKFPSDGATLVAQVPTGANTASAWPNSGHSKLIVTHRDAGGGVAAWDISDPSSPRIIDSADASDFGVNAYSAGPIFVLDQTGYVAWHQAGAQVLDLDLLHQTDTIFRTGAFTTSQASPLSKFVGNTSVFPLSHEKVLLADSKWGLYIVDASDVISTTVIPPIDLEATCSDIAAGRQSTDALAKALSQLGILAGDADQNGAVEFDDFLALAGNFGQTNAGYARGDFDCSGEVGFSDFLTLSGNFGRQPAASVPEPQTITLVSFGLLGTFLCRKRMLGKMSSDD